MNHKIEPNLFFLRAITSVNNNYLFLKYLIFCLRILPQEKRIKIKKKSILKED